MTRTLNYSLNGRWLWQLPCRICGAQMNISRSAYIKHCSKDTKPRHHNLNACIFADSSRANGHPDKKIIDGRQCDKHNYDSHEIRSLVAFIMKQEHRQTTTRALQNSNSRKYPTADAAENALRKLVPTWGEWIDINIGNTGGRPTRALRLHRDLQADHHKPSTEQLNHQGTLQEIAARLDRLEKEMQAIRCHRTTDNTTYYSDHEVSERMEQWKGSQKIGRRHIIDTILSALRKNTSGMTRTDIHRCVNRAVNNIEINLALQFLLDIKLAYKEYPKPPSRQIGRWHATVTKNQSNFLTTE